ncbi:MAG: hypothetical protein JF887_07225 [Candidatus Dormibacteraeota bacterium]|uniref:NADH:quinone oxidoreductase/Mrp antiporter transmembrane domain-containing protein n=1 Tax=Candidatus Amunia macphersoniae TaxID=3127014 RepID=A0A934KEX0_9BACT|nr:hypothetical protein [Candidatus Dormibacteraeota bacterium]
MTVILNLTWAIVLLPLVGVGASFLAESARRAAQTEIGFTAVAFAAALIVLVFRLTHVIPTYENSQTFWNLQPTSASAADTRLFSNNFLALYGIRVDPLSLAFMASTLFLSLITQVHALASLRGDPQFRRFFWVAGALTFGILATISSPNLFQLLLGWEVAGVAGWMLAAHHWDRPGVGARSTRTFVLLRVSDLALILALAMTFAKFGIAVQQRVSTAGQLPTDPFSFSVLSPLWHLGHVGLVAGVGARSLVVLAVLFVVAAVIRATVGPLHLWFSGALQAPVAGLALLAVSALMPATVVLARVYPLLLEAPRMLTVLALIGAAGAVAGALLATAQRDLFRIGMFAVSSQASLIMVALGMGGYSPALFMLFTGSCLCVVYFLTAGNLSRSYRTRDVADCGGGWRRMPRTMLALTGWAIGISGVSLNTYSVLSATLRNARPGGGTAAGVATAVVAAAVLLAMALTAVYAFRVVFLVGSGDPLRRRGFDIARLREVDPLQRRTALLALAGAVVATVVGIPGINAFTVGARRLPGFTFSHFIFYGGSRQQLALDVVALAIAAVLGAGGAAVAWWLFSAAPRTTVREVRVRLARVGTVLAGPTPGERAALRLPTVLVRAGQVLERVDGQFLSPIADATGESVNLASQWLTRLRTPRFAFSTAAAFAVIAVLLAASVLAVTGHFPVRTQ